MMTCAFFGVTVGLRGRPLVCLTMALRPITAYCMRIFLCNAKGLSGQTRSLRMSIKRGATFRRNPFLPYACPTQLSGRNGFLPKWLPVGGESKEGGESRICPVTNFSADSRFDFKDLQRAHYVYVTQALRLHIIA